METIENLIKSQLLLGKYQDQESAITESIKLGAKWQSKRMYSKEEVLDLFLLSSKMFFTNDEERVEWFNSKFKKSKS